MQRPDRKVFPQSVFMNVSVGNFSGRQAVVAALRGADRRPQLMKRESDVE